jgi:hypothetical protein
LILDSYDPLESDLPSETRSALEKFLNIVFWSWRGDEGKRTKDFNLNSEALDSSYSAETSSHLAHLLADLDWTAIEPLFELDEDFESFEEFRMYFDEWKAILDKASSSNKAVFVFVFP